VSLSKKIAAKYLTQKLAEQTKLAEEKARHRSIRGHLDAYAQKYKFTEPGEWTNSKGTHQGGPDSLWFHGTRCFVGEAKTTTVETPESVEAQALEYLAGLRNGFRGRAVTDAVFVFAIDDKEAVANWNDAMRTYIQKAGLQIKKDGPMVFGPGAYGVVYVVEPQRPGPYVRRAPAK
jgi:hypothetical protein